MQKRKLFVDGTKIWWRKNNNLWHVEKKVWILLTPCACLNYLLAFYGLKNLLYLLGDEIANSMGEWFES